MSKMIASILYCHERNVCHRDVKLDNFVYESDGEDAELKLIDFGLSHVLLHTQEKMHDRVGCPGRLRAPPTRPVPLPRGPAWRAPRARDPRARAPRARVPRARAAPTAAPCGLRTASRSAGKGGRAAWAAWRSAADLQVCWGLAAAAGLQVCRSAAGLQV